MWRNITSDDGLMINCVPINDDVEHHEGPDCVCGPDVEGIGGGAMLLVKHHSLDGRELSKDDDEDQDVGVSITAQFTTYSDGTTHFLTERSEDMSLPTHIGMLVGLVDRIEARIEELRGVGLD